MTEAYPLQWPIGWPRTPNQRREKSRFNTSQEAAQRQIVKEVNLLGGRNLVISTNLELRRDGLPYAASSKNRVDDVGVAIYFVLKGNARSFACDRWDTIKDNMKAIANTIAALRGIERWGSSQMVDQAFSGFTALPSNQERQWWDILQVNRAATRATIELNYKRLAQDYHPDRGGSSNKMAELNTARDQALKEVSS